MDDRETRIRTWKPASASARGLHRQIKHQESEIKHHKSQIVNPPAFTLIELLVVIVLPSAHVAGNVLGSDESALLEQALAVVKDCMASSPAPWPEAWQQEYLDTIRRTISNDANETDYTERVDIVRRGFPLYWSRADTIGLTQAEYDLRVAQIRWYCETLMGDETVPAAQRELLRRQLRELCDYAAQYLGARFPFLKRECTSEGQKAALREFDDHLAAPLIPLFRRPLSPDQLRQIRANWARLYSQWYFLWREARYAATDVLDESRPTEIANHPHTRFVGRCLGHLPQTIWPTCEKPPDYVLDALDRANAERAVRVLANRDIRKIERDLAIRFSNQVEQLEQWSFIFTAMLETGGCDRATSASFASTVKGGDAYGLSEQDLKSEPVSEQKESTNRREKP